uniref:Putative S-adenosylmethionine decarboxylase n=1 Tax=viral metagenome TaxID=1070528 RepID=A0A6M3IKC1_9ZZZZ
MNNFGKELILDLHNCDVSKFNRKDIKKYLIELCDMIDMIREDLHWWDYYGIPKEDQPFEEHLRGTSAIQFIRTSNITIHTLDLTGKVYINIFSCKDFNEVKAGAFTKKWFRGKIVNFKILKRI